LAAQSGLPEIADYLIGAGHEDDSISRNADWDTPLHLAVEKSEAVAALLATSFPRCIPWKNKQGADALMLTARSPHTALIPHLLALSPASDPFRNPNHLQSSPLQATDSSGNTPLHYASAYGQLKSIRTLLEHGADAGARNAWSWTPVSYSASVQAEVYFKGLVNASASGEREREGGGRSRGGSGGRRDPLGEMAGAPMRTPEGERSRGGSGGRRDHLGEMAVAGMRPDGGRSRGGSGGRRDGGEGTLFSVRGPEFGMRPGGGGGVRLVSAETDVGGFEGMRVRGVEDGRRRAGSGE